MSWPVGGGSELGEDWDVLSWLVGVEGLDVFNHVVMLVILFADAISSQVGEVGLVTCCSIPRLGIFCRNGMNQQLSPRAHGVKPQHVRISTGTVNVLCNTSTHLSACALARELRVHDTLPTVI